MLAFSIRALWVSTSGISQTSPDIHPQTQNIFLCIPPWPQPKTLSMDEYFEEDYKEGAIKCSKILGDLQKDP